MNSMVEWISNAMVTLRMLLGKSVAPAGPSSDLFQSIRWRLVVWYSAVLAVILLLGGVVLYLGVRQSLLGPVQNTMQTVAIASARQWQAYAVAAEQQGASTSPSAAVPLCPFVRDWAFACYDTHGDVIEAPHFAEQAPPEFLAPTLVGPALQNGQAQDTVQTGSFLGTIARYAVKVPDPNGGTLGVYQVGVPIGTYVHALGTLLHLELLFGLVTIFLAVFGGLILANRALLPAKLAYARQRDFIADASHELRTPLTMLRSNVEVVLRGKDRIPEEDVALLEDTVQEATHLTSLANNMLDLARLDRGEAHLETDVVDLTRLAREVARWSASMAAERGLTIDAGAAEPVLVAGDRTLLEQALLVLVDNALKYSNPGGHVDVNVWASQREAHLDVTDTGIGIELQHLARLGERFYRVDKARSRESGGAGLGLSIVRGIAARHGGCFQMQSEPGLGTTATLSLPILREAGSNVPSPPRIDESEHVLHHP